MVKPVTRDNIIGKYVEFIDKRRGDCKYRIGKVKKVTGVRKIWVSVQLPAKSKNRRIPFHWIKGTITKSGLRREIEW
jgi:hypothetical protein